MFSANQNKVISIAITGFTYYFVFSVRYLLH